MNIKKLRQQKGWTQDDLAVHSGLSTRTIQRVERGESVGAETIKCLAAVFEIDINTLFTDSNTDTDTYKTEAN